jgi:hypothetical protein
MNSNITRTVFRWIHLVFAIPILGYIYSPFDRLPSYAFKTRLFSSRQWSFPDFGCGKVMSFDG